MLDRVEIAGYRSIRKLAFEPGRLTVILGPNGAGKTNIYRALELVHAAATGTLARDLAAEGGMDSALWAGGGWREEEERETAARNTKGPRRIELYAGFDEVSYALTLGLPRPTDAALGLDPVVKAETVKALGARHAAILMDRNGPHLAARDADGQMQTVATDMLLPETALSSLSEPQAFPVLHLLRQTVMGWRFYHQFRADPDSPLRQAQPAITSPLLDADGGNWASAMLTQMALGDPAVVQEAVETGFPGARIEFADDAGRAEPMLYMPAFQRPFRAAELSDGTLRYLCLATIFSAYRQPGFMALNEPETSLHPDMIAPLAHLIGTASAQTLVVTHSETLAEILDLDHSAVVLRLIKERGETRIAD